MSFIFTPVMKQHLILTQISKKIENPLQGNIAILCIQIEFISTTAFRIALDNSLNLSESNDCSYLKFCL